MPLADKDVLRRQIHMAFDDVELPQRVEQMTLAGYSGDDAYDLASTLLGPGSHPVSS